MSKDQEDDQTLLVDLSQLENSINKLKPVHITKHSAIIMKSYELIVLNLESPDQA